jgi:protein pelota
MRILHQDRKHGTASVLVESNDDLWYLSTIIDAGDACTGQSEYKEKLVSGEKTKAVRRRVWVRLRVERVELEGSRLRVLGLVEDGSEEVPRGSHHGLDIAQGDEIELRKERWLALHWEKLEEAARGGTQTLLVLFDREHALFFVLRPGGHELVLELHGDVQKKGVDEAKAKSFFSEVAQHVRAQRERGIERIIAAGAQFWHEYLRRELSDVPVVFTTASAVDASAILEVLRRPEVAQQLAGERGAREAQLVERMLAALSRDKLAYGEADLAKAIVNGNLAELCVSENAIRSRRDAGTFAALERLMRSCEDVGAKVHLLSTKDAQRTLDGLGGVAGILRW